MAVAIYKVFFSSMQFDNLLFFYFMVTSISK